jgi:hypothetical protein
MAKQKLDISDYCANEAATTNLGNLVKNHVENTLIPGCAANIKFFDDGTAQADIYVQNKKLGHLILITEKREEQREARCSNAVLKYLLRGPIMLDINLGTKGTVNAHQLQPEDFEFAAVDEALQAQLDATPSTNPLKDKFEYSLKRCRTLWSRFRMCEKNEQGKIRFTISNGDSITVVIIDEHEIDRYTNIKSYTQALNAMTILLRNPNNQPAYQRLIDVVSSVVGSRHYDKQPVIGPILVGIGLLFAIVAIVSGVSIPFVGDFVFLRLICTIGGMLSFFSLVGGSIAWMNASASRHCGLAITGFSDALETVVEALQKKESHQPDSNRPEVVKEDNKPSHPAGDSSAYDEVIGQKAATEKPVAVRNLDLLDLAEKVDLQT